MRTGCVGRRRHARHYCIAAGGPVILGEWRASMEHLTGVTRADAVGRRADTVLPLFRDASLAALVSRAAAGETPETIELPHTTPGDNRSRWLEARCVPWRDDAGRVAGVAAFFTDVSNPQR